MIWLSDLRKEASPWPSGFDCFQLEQAWGSKVSWYNTPILLNIGRKLQIDNTQLQYNGRGHALMYPHHRYGLALCWRSWWVYYWRISARIHTSRSICQIIGAILSKFRRCECFNSMPAGQPWKWAAQMSRCMELGEVLVVGQAITEPTPYDRGSVEGDCQWYEHRYVWCSYDTLGNTNNSTLAGLLSAPNDRFYSELNGILLQTVNNMYICEVVKIPHLYLFLQTLRKKNIPR